MTVIGIVEEGFEGTFDKYNLYVITLAECWH